MGISSRSSTRDGLLVLEDDRLEREKAMFTNLTTSHIGNGNYLVCAIHRGFKVNDVKVAACRIVHHFETENEAREAAQQLTVGNTCAKVAWKASTEWIVLKDCKR